MREREGERERERQRERDREGERERESVDCLFIGTQKKIVVFILSVRLFRHTNTHKHTQSPYYKFQQVCSLIALCLSLANRLSDISHDARYRNWMIPNNTNHSSDELDAAVAAPFFFLFSPPYPDVVVMLPWAVACALTEDSSSEARKMRVSLASMTALCSCSKVKQNKHYPTRNRSF